jgi:hypothetical protein
VYRRKLALGVLVLCLTGALVSTFGQNDQANISDEVLVTKGTVAKNVEDGVTIVNIDLGHLSKAPRNYKLTKPYSIRVKGGIHETRTGSKLMIEAMTLSEMSRRFPKAGITRDQSPCELVGPAPYHCMHTQCSDFHHVCHHHTEDSNNYCACDPRAENE